jgi:hypothetical protein
MRFHACQLLAYAAAATVLVAAAAVSEPVNERQNPQKHWAFQPPVRPAVPQVGSPAWISNPIDSFIAQEHMRHGLIPQREASKPALLRRVYLDLIGLPPTREQLLAFLADDSPDAYEREVHRLLESPQYGERWARHWMDVWRYSDWYGRRMVPDVWNSAPQIWRWRDWIVRSLNSDKGYDRMIAEMLAGDEIDPTSDEAGYATAFLIRNWYALNPNDWMRSNVEHTTKAFLGLTVNCAHCHDHKYDPITQDDYFRFRAFFEPIGVRQDRVPGEADPGPFQEYSYSVLRKIVRLGAVRIYDKAPDAPTWFYTAGDERNRASERGSMLPGVPAFLSPTPIQIAPIELPAHAWYPGLRPAIQQTILAECRAAVADAERQLSEARPIAQAALPALRETLTAVQAEFAQATEAAEQAGHAGALAGRQSLVLDAAAGRRAVHNSMQQLKALDDSTSISFQLRILADTHVNFQLAKDVVKGLTAAYLGFDQGCIKSYQPGSVNEFEVGRYDFAAGETHFDVTLVLKTEEDRCLLTVRCPSDPLDSPRVREVPVALNGWNPVGDVTKGILFDARTGSVALVDELAITGPRSDTGHASGVPLSPRGGPGGVSGEGWPLLAYFNFESPTYVDGCDIAGIDGWQISSFSQAPATSVVSATAANEGLRSIANKLQAARRAVDVHELKVKSLEAKLLAAKAELESIESRIAADRARHADATGTGAEELARVASRTERETAILKAGADCLAKEQLLAVAQSRPSDDANRAKEVDAASKQLAATRSTLDKARAASADEGQADSYTPFGPTYPRTSTGRRRALAEWIASRNNPLTARVAVNHIWMRHFHAPLVASVYDFGRNGSPPTHPALLDWLAVEFMDSGWSMKHLHRLIVTSNAYRMASRVGPSGDSHLPADPENRLLGRMNVGRMESEVIRDSLLYCAGRLDMQMGGQELENSQAQTTQRRTLYYSCNPELDGKSQFGALFDAPEPGECYRRTRSVIPQQALALTNSELIHELSGAIASALWQGLTPEQQAEPSAFVIAACEQILSRRPSAAELETCSAFLSPQTGAEATDSERSRLRESLVRVLLNHNDFLAIR